MEKLLLVTIKKYNKCAKEVTDFKDFNSLDLHPKPYNAIL